MKLTMGDIENSMITTRNTLFDKKDETFLDLERKIGILVKNDEKCAIKALLRYMETEAVFDCNEIGHHVFSEVLDNTSFTYSVQSLESPTNDCVSIFLRYLENGYVFLSKEEENLSEELREEIYFPTEMYLCYKYKCTEYVTTPTKLTLDKDGKEVDASTFDYCVFSLKDNDLYAIKYSFILEDDEDIE